MGWGRKYGMEEKVCSSGSGGVLAVHEVEPCSERTKRRRQTVDVDAVGASCLSQSDSKNEFKE